MAIIDPTSTPYTPPAPPAYGYAPPSGPGRNYGRQLKAAIPLLGGAYGNLAEILASKGATDPRILNREITGIGRGTEGNIQEIQAQLARSGLGSSGLGQALAAAAGQSGVEDIATARARDAALQEQRKREDIMLAIQAILNPRQRQQEIQKSAPHGTQGSGLGGDALKAVAGILAAVLA